MLKIPRGGDDLAHGSWNPGIHSKFNGELLAFSPPSMIVKEHMSWQRPVSLR
jgi:hypothetical protein